MADDLGRRSDSADNPGDSGLPRHDEGLGEETSATGQRIKGSSKEGLGDLTDNESLERKGERENAAGKIRQKNNDAV